MRLNSKLQTQVALSTTEAEYIAVSYSLRDMIPIMDLVTEIRNPFQVICTAPNVFCKVFENNMRTCMALQSLILHKAH